MALHWFLPVLLLLACIQKARPACSPAEEGMPTTLTCDANIDSEICPNPDIVLTWRADALKNDLLTCGNNGCRGPYSDYFSANYTTNSSTLTINEVSRTNPFGMETRWICKPCDDLGEGVLACNDLQVYALPLYPSCKMEEIIADDFNSVPLVCTTLRVYPEARCSFYSKNNGGNRTKVTTRPEYTSFNMASTPTYYIFICKANVPVSELGEGTHSFQGYIYPNVTGGENLVNGIEISETVTLSLPESSHTCSSGMIQGHFTGTSVTCRCSLTSSGSGKPTGMAQWYQGDGAQVSASDGTLTVTYSTNSSEQNYTCDGVSALGRKVGSTLTAKFAFFELNSVEVVAPVSTVDHCDNNTRVLVTCRISRDKVSPAPTFLANISTEDSLSRTPLSGIVDDIYYQGQFYVYPQRVGGETRVTCNVSNTILEIQQESNFTIYFRSPPPDPPQVKVGGQTQKYQGVSVSNTVTLAEGYTGDVTCRVKGGYPDAHDTQLKCGNLDGSAGADNSTLSFATIPLTKAMDGTVCSCESQHVSGCYNNSKTTLMLNVIYLPLINITHNPPKSQTLRKGDNLELTCSTRGNPDPSSVSLTRERTNQALKVVQTPELNHVMDDLSCLDTGIYICSGQNGQGTSTQETSVEVHCPQQFIPSYDPPPVVLATIGESVNLEMEIYGFPEPSVLTLLRTDDHEDLTSSRRHSAVYTATRAPFGVLGVAIHNVTEEDFTNYTLTVGNAEGLLIYSFDLIDARPAINTPQTSVTGVENSAVRLSCEVTPLSSLTSLIWLKNGVTLTTSDPTKYSGGTRFEPSLTIFQASDSDVGTYACVAENPYGVSTSASLTLTVTYAPRLSVNGITVTASIGETIVLSCAVDANPVISDLYWTRANRGVAIDTVKNPQKYSGGSTDSPRLTIFGADSSDTGQYTCVAVNAVGTTTSDVVFVSVTALPQVTVSPSSPITLPEGTSQTTLQCTVSGNPPVNNVYWLLNGTLLNTQASPGKYAGSSTTVPSLTILNVNRDDAGQYVCAATNSIGATNSQSLELVVTYRPTLTVFNTPVTSGEGGTIVLTCIVDANPDITSFYWSRVGQGRISTASNSTKYGGGTITDQSLLIREATSSDSGQYFCTASNDIGTVTSLVISVSVKNTTPSTTADSPEDEERQTTTETTAAEESYRTTQLPTDTTPSTTADSSEDEERYTTKETTAGEEKSITSQLQSLRQDLITSGNVSKTVEALTELIVSAGKEEVSPLDVTLVADVLQNVTAAVDDLDPRTVENILWTLDAVSRLPEDTLQEGQSLGNSRNRMLAAANRLAGLVEIPDGKNNMQRIVSGGLGLEVWDLGKIKPDSDIIVGLKVLSDRPETTVKPEDFESQFSRSQTTYNGSDAVITLPGEFLRKYTGSSNVTKVRLAMNVYTVTGLFQGQDKGENGLNRTLNSKVISAQLLVDRVPVRDLQNYTVRTAFKPVRPSPTYDTSSLTTCVFWDFSANQNAGGWSSRGCQYERKQDGLDLCKCNHLTNFAVLLSFYEQSELEHTEVLGYITIVGLSLSITGLALSMLSFICIGKLRKSRPQQTLFQLCLALLLSWLVFLAGIERTSDHEGCLAVAAILHYLILASFMWMLMEGLLQYLLFLKVMKPFFNNYMLKTSIISWGFPIIPVLIIIAIDTELYSGGNYYCWMDLTAFYYGVALPVALIMAANLTVFVLVTVKLWRRKDMSRHSNQQTKQAVVNIRASFISFCVLGLSWIFGFLAIEDARLVFQYLFCISSSLQGFLIFLMMTARDKQVREYWIQHLCCCFKCLGTVDLSASGSSQSTTGSVRMLRVLRTWRRRNSSISESAETEFQRAETEFPSRQERGITTSYQPGSWGRTYNSAARNLGC